MFRVVSPVWAFGRQRPVVVSRYLAFGRQLPFAAFPGPWRDNVWAIPEDMWCLVFQRHVLAHTGPSRKTCYDGTYVYALTRFSKIVPTLEPLAVWLKIPNPVSSMPLGLEVELFRLLGNGKLSSADVSRLAVKAWGDGWGFGEPAVACALRDANSKSEIDEICRIEWASGNWAPSQGAARMASVATWGVTHGQCPARRPARRGGGGPV